MLALSIKQPWASLIAQGVKTIEMRTWSTSYRGPLVICASAKGKVSGHTVALVELVDVRLFYEEDSQLACYDDWEDDDDFTAFVLRLIRPLPPIPMKGRLRLYELPADVSQRIGS